VTFNALLAHNFTAVTGKLSIDRFAQIAAQPNNAAGVNRK